MRKRTTFHADFGIPCPICSSTERKVIESRPCTNYIKRRCVCQNCSARFTTTEKITHDEVMGYDFMLAILKGLSSIEKAISNLRKSIEVGLENYKTDGET